MSERDKNRERVIERVAQVRHALEQAYTALEFDGYTQLLVFEAQDAMDDIMRALAIPVDEDALPSDVLPMTMEWGRG